jgi:hypothetical protein
MGWNAHSRIFRILDFGCFFQKRIAPICGNFLMATELLLQPPCPNVVVLANGQRIK